jgi:hypothetical protein
MAVRVLSTSFAEVSAMRNLYNNVKMYYTKILHTNDDVVRPMMGESLYQSLAQ